MSLETPGAVMRRLIDDGIITAQQIVDLGVSAVDQSRSHSVTLVTVGEEGGYAVKQAVAPTSPYHGTAQREAAAYRLAATRPELRKWMPPIVGGIDQPVSGPLVLELVPGESLVMYDDRQGHVPAWAGDRLGRALGALHRVTCGDAGDEFPKLRPWVLTVYDDDLPHFVAGSPAMLDVLEMLAAHAGAQQAHDRLRDAWRRECVIHGDVKFDNCLVDPGTETFHLVDWELTDCGDPAWDVAGALHGFATNAVFAEGGRQPAALPQQLWPQRVRPAVAAFVAAYAAASALDEDTLAMRLDRSAAMLGGWMLQTALQQASWADAQTWPVPQVTTWSAALLAAPEEAARQLRDAAA